MLYGLSVSWLKALGKDPRTALLIKELFLISFNKTGFPFINSSRSLVEKAQDDIAKKRPVVLLNLLSGMVFFIHFFTFSYVVEPYKKYPSLLEVLLNFLKTEQSPGIRKEVRIISCNVYELVCF